MKVNADGSSIYMSCRTRLLVWKLMGYRRWTRSHTFGFRLRSEFWSKSFKTGEFAANPICFGVRANASSTSRV
jgi:hypothetical protein